MDRPTVGSLFSGIGGFDLGFERAGFEIAWQCEIDPWARKVLKKHWPSVECYEDIRTIGAHNLAPVDVLIGGFPCQDISSAGKGAGIDGERSGLWREYARLIRELRPRYAVMENVSALLHRGLDIVLADLAASGYDAEWQMLPAVAFGAPHRRDRCFIVAYPWGAGPCGRGPNEHQRERQEVWRCEQHRRYGGDGAMAYATSERWGQGRAGRFGGDCANGQVEQAAPVAHAEGQQNGGLRFPRLFSDFGAESVGDTPRGNGCTADWWAVEPPVGRVANGIPRRVDRLRGLGNAVVPQVAEYVAGCVLAHMRARIIP